jgi:phosphoglycerol transferase MdoB-like AlkP superfamily enzyme
MSRYFLALLKSLSLIAGLLFFYSVFRFCFFLFNQPTFSDLSFASILALMWHGLRFDISAVLAINGLLIVLLLLPFDTLKYRIFQKIIGIFFVITNSFALLFEMSDWIYFKFNHKRSTVDVLSMVTRKGDFFTLLPDFIRIYWYLFLVAVLVIWGYARFYKFIDKKFDKATKTALQNGTKIKPFFAFLLRTGILIFAAIFAVIGIRGGLQYVPINIRNAIEVSPPKYTSLVLNTPFSIINSWQGDRLQPLHYMPQATAVSLINPIKQYGKDKPFQKKNVVIIIVESLSKEFTKLGGVKSYTPFLDSLMDQSMTFTNAFANGLHSNEGIPAMVAGIPALMEEPITSTVYSNNHITALPGLLNDEGYATAFYHGATNGTMGFDIFAKEAGYQHYYGRTEYHNEKDYDGSWGIYDEPFLQYFAKGMDNMPQPFMTTIFTVTSHHPFPMPDKYKNKFPKGTIPMQESIGYTDYSLRLFFESVKNEAWFNNTIFVITADHCSPYATNEYYQTGTGRYQIPIIFYAPGDKNIKGQNDNLMQQIDVMPSLLDYLGYNKPFFSFGSSIFQPSEPKFMAAKLSGIYSWINNGYQLKISDDKIIEAYKFPSDTLSKFNLAKGCDTIRDIKTAKKNWEAFVQIYNDALINNKMYIPSSSQKTDKK